VSEKSAVRTGERTAAKDNGADGANGLVIGDADVAAWRFFLDGHFGNDGNAHAGADHAEKTAELAALKNDLRMEARGRRPGGEKGSADTARDPRGFALKFYTEEGNWDMVGNNTPSSSFAIR
jgi:hypothetical protein